MCDMNVFVSKIKIRKKRIVKGTCQWLSDGQYIAYKMPPYKVLKTGRFEMITKAEMKIIHS